MYVVRRQRVKEQETKFKDLRVQNLVASSFMGIIVVILYYVLKIRENYG